MQSSIKFCPHCGSMGTARLGHCKVCSQAVCERCGNIQHVKGVREPVHDSCLAKTGDSFSMIKFIK